MEFKDVLKEVYNAANEIFEDEYECCGEQILSVALDLYKFKVEQEKENNKPEWWQQYYPPNGVTVGLASPIIELYTKDRPDLAHYVEDTIESIKGPTCTI